MRHLSLTVPASLLLLLGVATDHAGAREPDPQRLQVFILAGQSNMVGHASTITIPRLFADERPEVQELAELVFKDGETVTRETVDELIAVRIARDDIRKKLRDNAIEGEEAIAAAREEMEQLEAEINAKTEAMRSAFAVSDRVYISSIADRNRRTGPLTVGYGANEDKIGPELGFGMSLAHQIDAPILIIKASWGGKSLNYNFRPPSADPYVLSEKEQDGDNPEQVAADAGLNYRMMTEHVNEVLANLADHHPDFDPDAGFDVAGFVWFQGFNDQFREDFKDNYEEHMITFVRDVRAEFDAPGMPFVIGVLGTGITEEKVGENAVSLAQRAAASAPELAGTIAAVESYELYDLSALEVFQKGWQDHFAEWCAVGSDRPYHYLGSGKFFVRFGDGLADAMVELIEEQ